MGKRPAGVELFEGDMGSNNGRVRPSMQRKEPPTMATGLERIAAKARCEPSSVYFAGASHHTGTSVGESATDSEGLGAGGGWPAVTEAKESFGSLG